jgi:hypothetical protein
VQAVFLEPPAEVLPSLEQLITQRALRRRAHPSRNQRLQRLGTHLRLGKAANLKDGLLLRGVELGVIDEGADLQLLAV